MTGASGAAEILAFEVRIVAGNHNNAMLIDRAVDRAVERAGYRLATLEIETLNAIRAVFKPAPRGAIQ